MANNGTAVLGIVVVVLAGLLVYVLMARPAAQPVVNVVATEDLYPRYRNWDLWPIPMFPNSMPFGGPKHRYPPPPPPPPPKINPPPPPGQLPIPPAPATPVPPPIEMFASV